MPSTSILSKLFAAISSGDLAGAREIASQIAKNEETKGHRRAASILKGSLNPNGAKGHTRAVPSFSPNRAAVISDGLAPIHDDVRLSDVVLRRRWRDELHEVIAEWHQRVKLTQMGIRHRSRLLFHGPPGCGKSLAAKALGRELDIPTYIVRFDSVIGAYLGQTAIHLRELFRFAETTACVLLFDEIDALGKRRGSPLDVGELDRIVISLMQELELCQVQGLVVATTNLAKNLDDALWRRFDIAIPFPRPNRTELAAYARRLCKAYRISYTGSVRNAMAGARSFADAEYAVENVVRRKAVKMISRQGGD